MPSLTRSFERAIAKAATLPDDEQDTLAALILAEIEDRVSQGSPQNGTEMVDGERCELLGRLPVERSTGRPRRSEAEGG